MTIINDEVIRAILTSKQNVPSIQVLNWNIEDITEKNSNNYATKISHIRAFYRHQTGENAPPQESTFFLKVPIDTSITRLLRELNFYGTEVVMYTQVLPQMYTIEEDEYFTPKQYYFDDEMSLVLEDLSQSGYKCATRDQNLDFKHCIYAIRCLAKFHALSVKLESTVGLPESVKRLPAYKKEEPITLLISNFIEQIPLFIDSVPQHLIDRYPNFVTYLKNLSAEMVIKSVNCSSSGNFNVLNHGDFQINNMMFKYDKFGTVEGVKLIDFQLTRWGSPAFDLSYFIVTSMNFEEYLKYFPSLMKIYLSTLNKILLKLDCPTLDMQSLLNDTETLYPYVLFSLSCFVPTIICDPNDSIDTDNMFKNGNMELNNMAKMYTKKFYREISAKWFEHFAKNGTLRIDEKNGLSNESNIDYEPTKNKRADISASTENCTPILKKIT